MGADHLAQTNALFRKNLVIQRRACKTNCCLILFPLLLCSVIGGMQIAINHASSPEAPTRSDCGCSDVSVDENAVGGLDCPSDCPLPRAPVLPPVLQIPRPVYRAVRDGLSPFTDLPDASCRGAGSCAATFLVTGSNRAFVANMTDNMFTAQNISVNLTDASALADFVLASEGYSMPRTFLQSKCTPNLTLSFPFQNGNETRAQDVGCTEGLMLWRDSSWLINDELYRGYYQGNNMNKTDEIAAAYDFLSSDPGNFNLVISYNSTNKYYYYYGEEDPVPLLNQEGSLQRPSLVQVTRLTNMASNAYLNLRGNNLKMSFNFVKEMPRAARHLSSQFDMSPLIGQLPFVWTMELLFPVILTNIVYEKQKKLRIMMKVHGLGDLPYWTISYCYFLLLSLLYVLSFMLFGSLLGLTFFLQNNYGVQFVFYFAYMNLQISFAFLMAAYFSSVRTATVTGYLYIFVSGLLGEFLFRPYVEDVFLSRSWITLMELVPAFSLYRIIYEFSQSVLLRNYIPSSGMQWMDLSDPKNGMASVLTVVVLEWFIFLLAAFYLDHFGSFQSGIRKAAVLFRSCSDRNRFQAAQQTIQLSESKAYVEMERTDVIKEMTGLSKPTSGTAYIEGMDIRFDMGRIYTGLGVCPQHDLLWESLTGREHLMFYGRLKKLKGAALDEATEQSLRSVNLFFGGVADKLVGKYSGGMKRRLSVAISLIGDPKVVYMDEPSSGLDPKSRKDLWKAVKSAKQDSTIILTSTLLHI